MILPTKVSSSLYDKQPRDFLEITIRAVIQTVLVFLLKRNGIMGLFEEKSNSGISGISTSGRPIQH